MTGSGGFTGRPGVATGVNLDLRGAVAGFVGAGLVLTALILLVGTNGILAAVRDLDAEYLVLIVGAALGWLVAWGMALRTVLAAMDIKTTRPHAVLMYASAAFANNITPFGQAGGEPFSALLISRSTDSVYEDGLAAIASVDALNFIPSIGLALIGVSYYLTTFAVGRRDVFLVLGGVLGMAVVVPAAAYLIWRSRAAVRRGIVRYLGPALHRIGQFIPRINPPSPETLHQRVSGFYRSLDRVAGDRGRIAKALAFSTVGWLCMMAALALTLVALGVGQTHVLVAALVVIPLGGLASLTPLPGGLGGVEFAIVILIVPITGISAGTATAAALIFRGATYWVPTVLGAGAAALLEGAEF